MKSPKDMIADLIGKAVDQDDLDRTDYFTKAASLAGPLTSDEVRELNRMRKIAVKRINLSGGQVN